jgi:membrane fusion protein (multidrug efflux system)
VSKEELNHAQSQLANAKSAMAAAQAGVVGAREQLASNQSLTDGTSVDQHPNVLAAAAKVREAWLATQRAALLAPVDGYVAKRTVQLGQRVAAGTPLMSIVPLKQVWVDANFKEVQLRKIRIGQPVTLVADVYGKKRRVPRQGSRASAWAPARPSPCCRRRTPPATGSRSCSGCRCASRWTRAGGAEPAARRPVDGRQVDITQQDGKTLADAPRQSATRRPGVRVAGAERRRRGAPHHRGNLGPRR